jgi:hypothetical protein
MLANRHRASVDIGRKDIMNTSRHLAAILALAATISTTAVAATTTIAFNGRNPTSGDAAQSGVCAAELQLDHGPADFGRPRPHGVLIPQ